MGWEEVNRSSFPTQDLLSKAFYPLLAVLAITEFTPMIFDSTRSLSISLMLAITSFASYFITLYLTSYLLDGFYPELNPTHSINSRHNDFIIYSIIYLVLLKIIDNLLPTHFAPLYFLVAYVIFIIYCGTEFVGIEQTDKNKVFIDLKSGESAILQTYDNVLPANTFPPEQEPVPSATETIDLTNSIWTLSFTDEAPKVEETFTLEKLSTWEGLSDAARITMGTGVYTTTIKVDKHQAKKTWSIDLGDVRESARVYVNGEFKGCLWCVPFTLDLGQCMVKGKNEIRIEVTNLPANRIAELDRQGVSWRKMEEINVVDLNYKKTTYEGWDPVPSGLNSTVKLYAK